MIKITLFSNDAGPTENIINIIKEFEYDYEWSIFVYEQSPARNLFEKANIKTTFIDANTNLEELLKKENPQILYVTTSWQNKTHITLIKLAKKLGIKSLSSMDHWVNYRQRFNYPQQNWQSNLPDFMSINDTYAYELANSYGFKGVLPIKFYTLLNDFKKLKTYSEQEKNQLLFISEPTLSVAKTLYNDENYWGFSEYELLETICDNLHLFQVEVLKIRLHPSDEPNKYDYIHEKYPHLQLKIENPYESDVFYSILESKKIIGVDGVVLFKAKILGKTSISLLLSNKRECTVPLFKENIIYDIKDIAQCKKQHSKEEIKNFGLPFNKLIEKILEKKELQAAVIGCGNIGGGYDTKDASEILSHAHAYTKHLDTTLTACCDVDTEKVDNFKEKWNQEIHVYTSTKEMIKRENLDIVSICTNTLSHFEILSLLLEKNIPYIICEKPFVSTLKQYETILDKLKDSTSKLLINYMRCFDPSILQLKQRLRTNTLGKICSFSAQINKGIIHNGSHILSLIEMLTGNITSISSTNYHQIEDDFIGNFIINTQEVSGVISTIDNLEYSTFFINIYCEKGYIVINELGFNIEIHKSAPSQVFEGANTLQREEKLPSTLSKYALNTLNFFLKNDTTNMVIQHLELSRKILLLHQALKTNSKEVYFEKM